MGPGMFCFALLAFAGTRAAVLDEAPRLGDVHPAVLAQSLAAVRQLGESGPCRREDHTTP